MLMDRFSVHYTVHIILVNSACQTDNCETELIVVKVFSCTQQTSVESNDRCNTANGTLLNGRRKLAAPSQNGFTEKYHQHNIAGNNIARRISQYNNIAVYLYQNN